MVHGWSVNSIRRCWFGGLIRLVADPPWNNLWEPLDFDVAGQAIMLGVLVGVVIGSGRCSSEDDGHHPDPEVEEQ